MEMIIFNNPHYVRSISVSPDGKMIAFGVLPTGKKGTKDPLIVVRSFTGETIIEQRFNDQTWTQIHCVQFSPDGRYLACGLSDGGVFVYNTETWQILGEKAAYKNAVNVISFHQGFSGELLLASGSTDVIVVRRITDHLGDPIQTFSGPKYGLFGLTFHKARKNLFLAAGDGDGVLWLWNVVSGNLVSSAPLRLEKSGAIWNIVSLNASRMLAATQMGKIYLIKFAKNILTAEKSIFAIQGCIFALAISRSKGFLASGGTSGQVVLHNLISAKEPLKAFDGHADYVWAVTFTPDGKKLLSASDDGTVRMWDLKHPESNEEPQEKCRI